MPRRNERTSARLAVLLAKIIAGAIAGGMLYLVCLPWLFDFNLFIVLPGCMGLGAVLGAVLDQRFFQWVEDWIEN